MCVLRSINIRILGLSGRPSCLAKRGTESYEEISEKERNLPLIQYSAHRAMSGFPDVKLVGMNDVGVVHVVYMFEKSDLHFFHGWVVT